MRAPLFSVFVNFLLWALPTQGLTSPKPPDFCPQYQAEYRVYWRGLLAGTAEHRVQATDQGCQAISQVKPRFRLLPFQYLEQSEFTHHQDQIQPLRFDFNWKEKKDRNQGYLQFDWAQAKAHQESSLKHESLALKPGTQDKISVIFQLRQYLKSAPSLRPGQYWDIPILEPKRYQVHRFRILNLETLKTPLGHLKTVVIEQRAEHSERYSILYFELKDFLLVKALQVKNGKTQTESELHQASFLK